jgi:hypothetical protein
MNKPVERKECPFQPSISPKRSRWKEDKWVLQPVPILLRERENVSSLYFKMMIVSLGLAS